MYNLYAVSGLPRDQRYTNYRVVMQMKRSMRYVHVYILLFNNHTVLFRLLPLIQCGRLRYSQVSCSLSLSGVPRILVQVAHVVVSVQMVTMVSLTVTRRPVMWMTRRRRSHTATLSSTSSCSWPRSTLWYN